MRILHTVGSLQRETGGTAQAVLGLTNALAHQGLDVHLWSPDAASNSNNHGSVSLHGGELDNVLSTLGKVNLLHDHGLWLLNNHKVACACQRLGILRIVSPHGMLEPWALQHKKWKKRLAWILYQRHDLIRASALHATAESEAEQFRSLGLKNHIHVVPNGVDLPEANYLFQKPITATTPRIKKALFLSRLHPKKGLPMLMKAWASVRPINWKMQIVGPDADGYREKLKKLVCEAGLENDWSFESFLEGHAKAAAFEEADLFILPSFSENFGIAVAEALAFGVPVITTVGTPWGGLQKHQCGWWIEPEEKALTNALKEAVNCDDSVLQAMGQRGADWMKRDFSWSGVAAQMVRAYEEILRLSR